MNYKMILNTIGNIFKLEALLLILPLGVSLIYRENTYLSFIIPIVILTLLGFALTIKKPKNRTMYAREGFIVVGLSWILVSLFGALPFVISKEIPNFINAFFETVSGFTTTGASILTDVEALSKGILFWRSFTHWVGGMGILVFIMAIIPSSDGDTIHILRAESPGPQVGKLVSKIKLNARILYLIYFALTIIEIIMLLFGKMPLFDAVVHSFGTAGTGGFGIKNSSIGAYNNYCQIVIGIFMIMFGINFNIFYFILVGNFRQAFKSEELRWYLSIILIAISIITLNIMLSDVNAVFSTTLKDAFFQVSSIITTTGYSTTDFNAWPELSRSILIILMFFGACAGSTGGGIKISRLAMLVKSSKREISKQMHPHRVQNVRFEGSVLSEDTVKGVFSYFSIFMIIFVVCVLLVGIENKDFVTNFSAVAACINNIGPGLSIVGPMGNYVSFSIFSKIVLIFAMLVGRLEIFPILMLFIPSVWKRR